MKKLLCSVFVLLLVVALIPYATGIAEAGNAATSWGKIKSDGSDGAVKAPPNSEGLSLHITLDIFSGRPNPVIELTGKEAEDAMDRLQPVREIEEGRKGLPSIPTLGYRGLIIQVTAGEPPWGLPKEFRFAHGDMYGENLAHRAKDERFEDFILEEFAERLGLDEDFLQFVKTEIDRFADVREKLVIRDQGAWPPWGGCACSPLYEPEWWNVPDIQPYNNCYNYGTNYRSDTYAQPGRGAGQMYGSLYCYEVKPAAERDELIDFPDADNQCPDEGHLVALVIAPGWDFHWYRKHRSGFWSHKPGSGSATNRDSSGQYISDPRTADRGMYTDFCTFMIVQNGHIKIK